MKLSAAAAVAGGITITGIAAPQPSTLRLPGRLVWDEDHTVRIYSPFSGRVTAIDVKPGDHVSAGQTLARLSSADYGSAQADARKAKAALTMAEKADVRSRDLLEHGVIASKDAEQAVADHAAAQAESQRAQARLKLFGDVASGVDQLYRLTSPIDGIVAQRALNPGQEVLADQSGAPLFVVTDPRTLWLMLDAHDSELAGLSLGQHLRVESSIYPDQSFDGELTQIADFVDPLTRTLKLRGRVPNTDRRLKAEMYVSALLPLPARGTPTIPAAAVFLSGEVQQLFVVSGDHTYTRRTVRVGPEIGGQMPVVEGLKPGDQVVVGGSLLLQQLLHTHEGS
ncbi:MAG: hypothetical protein NVS9B10_10800 [Nevskia sp.]